MTRPIRIPFLRDPHECEEVRARMTDYLDEDLDDAQQRRVQRHVRFCPRCRRALGNLRITIDRLSGLGSTPTVESNDEKAITARITRAWRGQRE